MEQNVPGHGTIVNPVFKSIKVRDNENNNYKKRQEGQATFESNELWHTDEFSIGRQQVWRHRQPALVCQTC
jgi:hypothetical protein